MGDDRIEIRGLVAEAVHGATVPERHSAQPFEIDLDLYLDVTGASAADDLGATADYAAAVEAVMAVLRGRHRALLETLAEDMAAAVLADSRVGAVTVTVRKLAPPVPERMRSAGVRVTRRR